MTLSPDEIAKIKAHREAARHWIADFWTLAHQVCDEYGVTINELRAPTRGPKEVCDARDMLCHLASCRGVSQQKIGMLLRRDHTSISAALKRVAAVLENTDLQEP